MYVGKIMLRQNEYGKGEVSSHWERWKKSFWQGSGWLTLRKVYGKSLMSDLKALHKESVCI